MIFSDTPIVLVKNIILVERFMWPSLILTTCVHVRASAISIFHFGKCQSSARHLRSSHYEYMHGFSWKIDRNQLLLRFNRFFHARIPYFFTKRLEQLYSYFFFISHGPLALLALNTKKQQNRCDMKARTQFCKCQDLIGDNVQIMKNRKPRVKLGSPCARDAIFHPDKHPDWSLSLLISACFPVSRNLASCAFAKPT